MNKPRLKWTRRGFRPVNWEATAIAVAWNIELDVKKIYDKEKQR